MPGRPDLFLPVATDRCSIFDFVLNILIDFKGEVLNALSVFWVKKVIGDLCLTDLVAYGADIDQFLPEHLRGNEYLQKRATVVKRLPEPEVEDIVRFYLCGSSLKPYKESGEVCGNRLPPGLSEGDRLPYSIYTPTTKAKVGHDEHITADSVVKKYGFLRERLSLQVAGLIATYAAERGIIKADTKFEWSRLPDGSLVLVDEKATPDSSRFWSAADWQKYHAKGKLPPFLDKQYVREYGKKLGIDKLDPKNPEDVAKVHTIVFPDDVREMTTWIFRYIFWRLTGQKIEYFQRSEMGIDVEIPKPRVEILVGSESDRPQIEQGLQVLSAAGAKFRVSVISCHRNPAELELFSADLARADVVIAGAGKAAALPGIVKSWLCARECPQIPVIGMAFKGQNSDDDQDAVSSIEGLPGQPVELDPNGQAYFGPQGFVSACKAAADDEFLPKTIEKKPVVYGEWNH